MKIHVVVSVQQVVADVGLKTKLVFVFVLMDPLIQNSAMEAQALLGKKQQQPEDDEMLVPHTDFPQGPQPMEVAQSETANTVDAQPVDDPPSARFTWTIDSFSRINMKKLYSDVFYVGGYKWRILIFPKGNNVDHLSMYLDVADSSTLPYGWSRYA